MMHSSLFFGLAGIIMMVSAGITAFFNSEAAKIVATVGVFCFFAMQASCDMERKKLERGDDDKL